MLDRLMNYPKAVAIFISVGILATLVFSLVAPYYKTAPAGSVKEYIGYHWMTILAAILVYQYIQGRLITLIYHNVGIPVEHRSRVGCAILTMNFSVVGLWLIFVINQAAYLRHIGIA